MCWILALSSCFLWWRILLFCSFVISSRYYTPSFLLGRRKYAYSSCVLSSCVVDVVDLFFYFSSLPSLFRFRFGHRLFHPVFFLRVLCGLLGFGFCCDFLILYDTHFDMYCTYPELTFFYFCLRCTICLLIVRIILCFYLFSA